MNDVENLLDSSLNILSITITIMISMAYGYDYPTPIYMANGPNGPSM